MKSVFIRFAKRVGMKQVRRMREETESRYINTINNWPIKKSELPKVAPPGSK